MRVIDKWHRRHERLSLGARLMRWTMRPRRMPLALPPFPRRPVVQCPWALDGETTLSIPLPETMTKREARRLMLMIALWAFDDDAVDALRGAK